MKPGSQGLEGLSEQTSFWQVQGKANWIEFPLDSPGEDSGGMVAGPSGSLAPGMSLGHGGQEDPETCYHSWFPWRLRMLRLGRSSLGLTSFPPGADPKMTGPQRLAPAQQLSEVPRPSPDPAAAGVWSVCVAVPTCQMGGGGNNTHRKDRCVGFTCIRGVPGEGGCSACTHP